MQTQAVTAAKKALRQRVVALRDALSANDRARKSAAIAGRLVALPAFAAARTVAAYMSFGTELDTSEFLAVALTEGKRLLLPRIAPERREIDFHFVTDLDKSLLPGPWGIREPDPAHCAEARADEIDFMLIPGVAFTRRGERLGYGGGFYDVAIGKTRPDAAKVAAAFDLQIVDELPVEPHDRRVDLVVTESVSYAADA